MMTSKKTPASIDVEILEKPVVDNSSPAPENPKEKKDGLKDKEELLKRDDDTCEEVKEIDLGTLPLISVPVRPHSSGRVTIPKR